MPNWLKGALIALVSVAATLALVQMMRSPVEGRAPDVNVLRTADGKPDLNGKTLYDWAVERGVPLTSAGAAPLVIEGVLNGGASMVFHVMDEGDVQRIMKHRWTAIASDGALSRPGQSVPHPRNYGTFPRVLGRYVRELKSLRLEEAVRRMSSLPAATFRLADRGVLRAAVGRFVRRYPWGCGALTHLDYQSVNRASQQRSANSGRRGSNEWTILLRSLAPRER